jgi:hypothetical protein
VLTSNATGERTDLAPADFAFTDATTIGSVGFEQNSPIITDDGNAPVTGVPEQQTLFLTDVTLAIGESITFTWDGDGPGGAAPRTFTYTNNTGQSLTQNGGALADELVAAANNNTQAGIDFDQNWSAVRDGNNVVFTATTAGAFAANEDRPLIVVSGDLGGGDIFSLSETTQGAEPVAGDDEDAFFRFDGVSTGDDQVIFDGITVTFADGDTAGDMAAAFISQYNLAGTGTFLASAPAFFEPYGLFPGGVELESFVDANLPDITVGDFQFIDDNNVGTPSVGVVTTQQGSTASVTLNNFLSGSTLTLNAALGTHTVNMVTDTATDVLNLVTNNNGDHGTVTANQAETVNIITDFSVVSSLDELVLNGTDLTTLNVSGSDGLDLGTNSTIISTIDASGLGGTFIWSADANTVNITVSTGSGGSIVDFSGMTIPGGNTTAGNAPITFLGGSGDDTIITGDEGTSRGTITTGGGFDTVEVGIIDGGNDFWSITDFDTTRDSLDFDAAETFIGLDQVLEPTATFQDYLDQAARGDELGAVRYFYFNGDTYVVQDNTVGEDFVDGSDTVIRLEGELVLDATNFG